MSEIRTRIGLDTTDFSRGLQKAQAQSALASGNIAKSFQGVNSAIRLASMAMRGFGAIGLFTAAIAGAKRLGESLAAISTSLKNPESAMNTFIFKLETAFTWNEKNRDAIKQQRDEIIEKYKAEQIYLDSLEAGLALQAQIDATIKRMNEKRMSDTDLLKSLEQDRVQALRDAEANASIDYELSQKKRLQALQLQERIEALSLKLNKELIDEYNKQNNAIRAKTESLMQQIKAEQGLQREAVSAFRLQNASGAERVKNLQAEIKELMRMSEFYEGISELALDSAGAAESLLQAEKLRTQAIQKSGEYMQIQRDISNELAAGEKQRAFDALSDREKVIALTEREVELREQASKGDLSAAKELNSVIGQRIQIEKSIADQAKRDQEELHKEKMKQIEEAKNAELKRIDDILEKEKARIMGGSINEAFSRDEQKTMRTAEFGRAFRSEQNQRRSMGMDDETREEFARRKKLELVEQQAAEARRQAEQQAIGTPTAPQTGAVTQAAQSHAEQMADAAGGEEVKKDEAQTDALKTIAESIANIETTLDALKANLSGG